MNNFTAEQILKINEIFSRIVDCNGNLKVFNGAWDKYKNYTAIYEEDSNGNKSIQATYSTKVSLEDIYNNAKKALSICNVGNIVDKNIITPLKTFDISSKVSKAKIGDQADAHFSVLLHQCPDLKEEDFNTLYNAFYDVLAICGYDFNSSDNHTILYLNIFQRLLEYFRKGDVKFDIKDGNVKLVDDELTKRLREFFVINRIICKFKNYVARNLNTMISNGYRHIDTGNFAETLTDEEKEVYEKYGGVLRDIFGNFRKCITNAFGKLTQNGIKNIIYYGAPGTGKTKFVKDCLDILDPNRTRTEWVQFHSGFEYEDFIDGIKPIGIQNGNLNLALTNGIFKEFCLKAAQNEKENFFFIVDEINRADIAAVFGETLSLLEENYRGKSSAIKIKNSALMEDIIVSDASKKSLCIDYGNLQTKFYIPANIYFIGMMNDVDKSIDCFDLALRRRFAWVLMECDYEVVENVTDEDYTAKCKNLNQYITGKTYELNGKQEQDGLNLGRAYEIGHSYFLKKEAMSEQQIWDRHIEPILREYIRTQFGDRDAEDKLNIAREIFVG
ncbi:MAG: AAA family ATPase [Campylobacter concisus]|nr:AAA family ATPase [Campylobacter concisus]